MRSLISLIAIALWLQILQLRWSFGQDCEFLLENGTSIGKPEFGVLLPAVLDVDTTGKELLTAKAINVRSIKSITSSHSPHYIEASLNDTHLLLELSEEFANYEKYESSTSMSIIIEFLCMSTSQSIEFVLMVIDTNNHAPEFVNTPYIYKLPMPLPNDLALTNFAPIAARDIDLTNTNVSFRLDGDSSGFLASWLSIDSTDRKRHNAKLVTTAVINLVEDVTFNLTATDTGIPPQETTTTVTIKVDRENSILRFAQPLYTANLTELTPEAADGSVINFAEGDVSLAGGADKTVIYSVQDKFSDYGKNFELTTVDDHATVQVRLVDPPSKILGESFIVLKLTASKPGASETTILHISLPGSRKSIPESEDSENFPIATMVLSILLVVVGVSLIASVIMHCRHWRK